MSLKPPVSDQDHMQGNPRAVVELVEYGDYQCPHCGKAYPLIKAMQLKFGDDLKFVFRNFPLSEIHPQAQMAAVAAEAAGRQGRFWEMHDIIFENQADLRTSSLIEYARAIGLDTDQFKADIDDETFLKKVEADFESGVRSGVNGTPSFFINGDKYNQYWDEDQLSDDIKSKIGLLSQNQA